MSDPPAAALHVLGVPGLPEVRPGDDLAALIAGCGTTLLDGDVLVVTSKVVSKAEGRLVEAGTDRERVRQAAIDAETVRVVAARGELRVVQNRNGFVMAGAGVDASNVAGSQIALLPVDPDASAARLRAGLADRLGVSVGVIISDSFGRPWRAGIIDVAIGVAGLSAVVDHRGRIDGFGNELAVTEVALADELAAAGDLVKGKLSGIPVAVVRGLDLADDGRGAKSLVRDAELDMFSLGTAEARAMGYADALAGAATPEPGTAALHADAVRLLSGTDHPLAQAYLGFLAARGDAMRRSCAPGHLTASAVVFSAGFDQVLLTLHPRVGRWVQLGGHCEPGDETVLAAAEREALEESGIPGLVFRPLPVDLHVHPITCSLGVPTRHFDVRFAAVAPTGAEPVRSSESLDLAWFPVDELPDAVAPEIPALVRSARDAW